MKRMQIQLDEEQAKALRRLARNEGRPIAEMIRRSVDALLRSSQQPTREELRRRAQQAIGRFHSGATDTSSRHDEYLARAYRD
jgi:hypothetical protein